MKDDGSGIASAAGSEPSGFTYSNYYKQTSFGGPSYSKARHELYMFGGGHAATTLNAVSRWNLNKDAPDMTVVVQSSSAAARASGWASSSAYEPDGKPKAAHVYHGLQYVDAADELLSVTLTNVHASNGGVNTFPVVAAWHRGDANWKSAGYYPDVPTEAVGHPGVQDAPCFADWSGTNVYFYRDLGGSGPWRKVNSVTKTIDAVGGSLKWWQGMIGAARHDENTALILGGESGGPGSGYRAKVLNLSTGSYTSMNTTGYSAPGDCTIKDLVWVSQHGYWVGWFTDSIDDNNNPSVSRVIKFVKTDASTIAATLMSLTGTPIAGTGGCKQGLYYDPNFDCLIFVGNMNENLRAVKMS